MDMHLVTAARLLSIAIFLCLAISVHAVDSDPVADAVLPEWEDQSQEVRPENVPRSKLRKEKTVELPASPVTDPLFEDKSQVHSTDEMEALEQQLEIDLNRIRTEKEIQEHQESIRKMLINPMAPPSLADIHEYLSQDIVGISESIDTFFVNDRIIDGRNRTHLRVLSALNTVEREGSRGDVDFRLRFRLPRLEEKIQFEVNNLDNNISGDTDVSTTSATKNTAAQLAPQGQRQNTTAGLSFFKDVIGVRSKLTTGFIFRDAAPYGNWRLSKNIQFTEKDNLMLINDVFGDTEDRTGHRATIYYDHNFSQNTMFRFSNESVYRNEFHTFNTVHGVTLFQVFNDRNSIAHTASIASQNPQYSHSFFLSSYDIYSTYRYRIYKKHAFFDVIPGLSFPKNYAFESNWSIIFRLEIIFGSV